MMTKDTTQRGYGTAHQKLRGKWARTIRRVGSVPCSRCGMPVYRDTPNADVVGHHPLCKGKRGCQGDCWTTWHLDHNDDRTGYLGPAHSLCNTSAGGRKAHATPTPQGTPHPSTPLAMHHPPVPWPGGHATPSPTRADLSVSREW